jgi:Cu/Ag efflux protein CusF
MNSLRSRLVILISAIFCLSLSVAYAQQTAKKEKEIALKGKVESVDAKAKTVKVKNENIQGVMPEMSMTYQVDKADLLKTLKPGDQITATVHEDFKTLYDVKVVPPADTPVRPAALPAKK